MEKNRKSEIEWRRAANRTDCSLRQTRWKNRGKSRREIIERSVDRWFENSQMEIFIERWEKRRRKKEESHLPLTEWSISWWRGVHEPPKLSSMLERVVGDCSSRWDKFRGCWIQWRARIDERVKAPAAETTSCNTPGHRRIFRDTLEPQTRNSLSIF